MLVECKQRAFHNSNTACLHGLTEFDDKDVLVEALVVILSLTQNKDKMVPKNVPGANSVLKDLLKHKFALTCPDLKQVPPLETVLELFILNLDKHGTIVVLLIVVAGVKKTV